MKKVYCSLFLLFVGLVSGFAVGSGEFELTDTKRFDSARNVRYMNERYVVFNCDDAEGYEEFRIKDLESGRETILSNTANVFPFEIKGKFNVLIRDRYNDFYLTHDLKVNPFKGRPYYLVYPFYDGAAIVSDNKRFWLIDVRGDVIRDDIVCSSGYFSEGMTIVTLDNGQCGAMNPSGDILFDVPSMFLPDKEYDYVFSDGVMVLSNGRYGENHISAVMDINGKILFETQYYLSDYSEGVAACFKDKENCLRDYGFVDKDNNFVVPMVLETRQGWLLPKYEDGFIQVEYRGKMVKVDKTGKVYSIEDGKQIYDLWKAEEKRDESQPEETENKGIIRKIREKVFGVI